jgi:hypothetical protein
MILNKIELYRIDQKSFVSWVAAILVMPYVAWRAMVQITPELTFDNVVLSFLFACWLIVSALLYRTFKTNAKKKSKP